MIPIYQVDSFTSKAFAGNPAAVVILPQPKEDHWLKAVAAEMNLSETAFLQRAEGGWHLRWFTPQVEVDLCGHASLASAHVLFSQGYEAGDEITFFSNSGELKAKKAGDWLELDFPAEPPQPADLPPVIITTLGFQPLYIGRNRFDYIVEAPSEEVIRKLAPDMAILATLDERGLMVTAPASTPGYDFVSRFFAPGIGIPEDPVTGSAHCCLGPYWQERLGKTQFLARQLSPRGGDVRVTLQGQRVLLGGQAVLVLKGELLG
jgi:predicted PhzF superfamily epimerase YddE/YHI9